MTSHPTTSKDSATSRGDDERLAFRYTASLADRIELRWQAHWEEHETFRTPNPGEPGFQASRPKFYCLDMFPYPSGAGLHVGHPEGYTATDIICRFRRLKGENVLHPMGWDAFGLPAEQYAIQTGVHPAQTTRTAIENFRRQLKRFGFSYDWNREFATIDEAYYRWTQWIWLQAYDSWYDDEQRRARRIATLHEALQRDEFRVSAEDELIRPPAAGAPHTAWNAAVPWAQLTQERQRAVIDGQRLAYLALQTVNWCPKLGTALANEEVIDGRSERGGHPVFRRPLKQWMFRITAYADRLLADLDLVAWPESTRAMQAAWIGRSEGAEIDFPLVEPTPGDSASIRVYTTRPDTIFGATFMVLAPEHPLVQEILHHPRPETDLAAVKAYVDQASRRSDLDRMAEIREKTGVFSGAFAVNPARGEPIPILIADYVLMGYGHGAIMAVPAHDERDDQFAQRFGLPRITVVEPEPDERSSASDGACYSGEGRGVNSANEEVSLNDLPTAKAKETIIRWLELRGVGRRQVNFRLRDWLFSRQRYWGEPFPIVYDEQGRSYPIDTSHLPVTLPDLEDFTPVESDEPVPLLAKATDWINTSAGEAGVNPALLPPDTPVIREKNTMPGWAGSCWYYLRFCDPTNEQRFVSRAAERYWMLSCRSGAPAGPDEPYDPRRHHAGGVDLYIGGAEHAVLHLLYARFWHKLLFDLGEVSTPEPFGRLFHQGMITSYAYERSDRSLVAITDVQAKEDGTFVEIATGETVTQTTAKMSKSLRNVINPDDVIAEYGADTFRLYEMYMGPLDQTKPWNPRDITGPFRFLQRSWRLVVDEGTGELRLRPEADADVERQLHRTIAKVEQDIERLSFNTAIAALIELVNLATASGGLTADQLERFAIILSPFAPHLSEELWSKLGHDRSIAHATWPAVDESMLTESTVELPVQVQGKVRGRITVPADAEPAAVEQTALSDARIAEVVAGRPVKKVIVIPGRIVNIILG